MTKQSISRGLTTTSLYDFKYIPTSAVYNNEEQLKFIIKIAKVVSKIVLTKEGIFDSTDILKLSELLNSEAIYNLDFNKDNSIGDTIVSVLAIDATNDNGLYKTASGAFVADISNLSVGDSTSEPLIFINKLPGGKSSLYNFKSDPTGIYPLKTVVG